MLSKAVLDMLLRRTLVNETGHNTTAKGSTALESNHTPAAVALQFTSSRVNTMTIGLVVFMLLWAANSKRIPMETLHQQTSGCTHLVIAKIAHNMFCFVRVLNVCLVPCGGVEMP